MTDYYIAAAGIAVLLYSNLDRIKSIFKRSTVLPDQGTGLMDYIKHLRYFMVLQNKEARERGLDALDTVESLVVQQPRLMQRNEQDEN